MPNKKKKDNIRLSIEKEWPSARAFGTILPNYMITPDSTFTRLKTGAGDIEYFNEPSINYGSEDSPNIILNPNGNIPTLLYSPLNNSLDDVKLDLLHHYRLYDPVYLDLLQDYTSTLNKSEILWNSLLGDLFRSKYPDTYNKHWKEWDALVNSTPDNSLYMVLGIDGSLRNLLAKEETIKKSNYAPREEAILQYLNTPKAQQAFNNIQLYLESSRLPEVIVTPNSHADGGKLSTPLDWNELTMKEKAAYIRMGVANGYKDIDSIKKVYNEFKCGGNLYKEGGPKKQEYIYDVLPRLLKEAGLNIRVTSGYRKPGVVGTAGNRSWHPRHGAVDIVPMGKTTFEDIEEVLHTNPTIVKYMLNNGFGLLDESGRSLASKDTMKRTGATGAHFHIGRDSKPAALYKQRVALYSPMATTDNRKMYFSNPHLPIPEDLPQPRQAVSIPTPAKPLLNTTLDSNIPTDLIVMQLEEPIVDRQIPEVVVTEQAPKYYVRPNPQELLDLMNSMMVPYELPEIPKPITATERLAQLNLDKNSLLLQDLENSILRANRLGTPLDEVKLARDVKDLQFYRNMAADGGNLFLKGGSLVDTANAHIYDGTTEDSLQMNDDYIFTGAPSQYDFQVTAEAPTVYWDGFNWIGFNDLGQRVTKGPDFNPSGARIIENPQEFENARLAQARRADINGTHRFAEKVRGVATLAAMAPMAGPLVEAATAVAPTAMPWIKGAMELGVRPTSTIVRGLSSYIPQVSKVLPYMESIDRGIWGTSGLLGMKDAYEGWLSGEKHWGNALAESALEGMMMTELSPAVRYANELTGRGLSSAARGIDWAARKSYAPYDFYRTILETTPRTTPTLHGFHSSDLTGSGFVEHVYTGSPLFEFGQTIRTSPEKAYFMRAPKDVDILKLGNGSFRHEVVGNEILPSGEVNGKFVSYGEPWQEFALGENSALYEFPVGPRRGPGLMATDWKGRPQKYSVDEIYDYMQREEALNRAFRKDVAELGLDKLKGSERVKAYRALKEEKYPELLEHYDTSIYGANQTVIPNERWNFDRFLKTPFWKYSENPLSGQVQKELIMKWPEAEPIEIPTLNWVDVAKTSTITSELKVPVKTKNADWSKLFKNPEHSGVRSSVITDPNDANFVLKIPKEGLTLELVQLAIALNQTLGKYPFMLPLEHVETITGDDGLFYPIWRQLKITPYGREAIFGPDGKLLQGEALEALRAKSNELVEAIRQLAQLQGLQLLDGRILTPDGLILDFGEFHNVGITSDGRPVIYDGLLNVKLKNLLNELWDKMYTDAIKSGDSKKELEIVNAYAKARGAVLDELGNPITAYRGQSSNTRTGTFKALTLELNGRKRIKEHNASELGIGEHREGVWTTTDKKYAKQYTANNKFDIRRAKEEGRELHEYGKDKLVAPYYIFADKVTETPMPLSSFNVYEAAHGSNTLDYFEPYKEALKDYEVIKGHDAPVPFIHIPGEVEKPYWYNSQGTEYLIKNPKKVKLSLTRTYDDEGNLIPLTKRFNFNINDARYSWLPWLLGGASIGTINTTNR